jgi:non-specific serine/threonine protein kinase
MQVARSEHPAAVLDGVVYVFGGLVSTAQGTMATASVEALDLDNDTWSAAPDLPSPRHHAMAAAAAGRVYVMGGFDARGFNPVATAWSWAPGEEEWTPLPDLPIAIGAASAVVVNDVIYLVGGVPTGNSLLALAPGTDVFTQLADADRQREHLGAAALDGRIWAIGGRWRSTMRRDVEVYDPATGEWSAGPPMAEARSGFGATVVDGNIVVGGGEVFGPDRALASTEILAGDDWSSFEPLPSPLHGLPLVTIDDRVLALSGSSLAAGVENTGAVWSIAPQPAMP